MRAAAWEFTAAVITFNVKDKLRICLDSVRRHFPGLPIRIWDNGSTDGTAEMVSAEYPEVRYHFCPVNLFFARGCNELIARCATEYVLLMNADIQLIDASTARIAEYMRTRDDLVAVSPAIRDHGLLRHMASAVITPGLCIGRDSFWAAAARRSAAYRRAMYETMEPRRIFDAEKITNCCCCVRREAFLEMGGFATRQILYWTEEDFAVRVLRRGLRQAVYGESIVEHDHGSSTVKLPAGLVRAIHVRDRIAYMRSLFGMPAALLVEIALLRPRIWRSLFEHGRYWSHHADLVRLERMIVRYPAGTV